MRAILLNGPPSSGKDTIGGMLWRKFQGSHVVKFSQPIIDFMLREFSIDMNRVDKDMLHPHTPGRTPRQVAIAYSENFCKPLFGPVYFGYTAVEKLQAYSKTGVEVAIYTDSGFVQEAKPVLDYCGKGRVLQVVLHRNGCHFSNDSRSIWEHPDIGRVEFENKAPTIEALKQDVEKFLMPEIEGWLIHS